MTSKKYLIIAFAVSAGVAFGVFSFAPVSKTIYIKNNASFLASADVNSNNIIPSITVPGNLTENFAKVLAQQIISDNSDNSETKTNLPSQQGLAMPDVNAMAENFITDGLKQANKNILNIKALNLSVSYDNGKPAIETYFSEIQTIINNNLKSDTSLFAILDEINKNNGAGRGKLLPIISAHEVAANQIEQKPVPSSLKNLMAEEIRLMRITANILRALINIESDPLGAMAATQQFEAVMQNWAELQNKFDAFIISFSKK